MAQHKDLTGVDLHEPKGAAAASANTVYVANGAGSGAWGKVAASQLDLAAVPSLSNEQLVFYFPDVNTGATKYLSFTRNVTITKVQTVVNNAMAANITMTFRNNASVSMGNIVLTLLDAAGSVRNLVPGSNNVFTAGQRMELISAGGASPTDVYVTLDVRWD